MNDETARQYATQYVLQRYHLLDLNEAQQQLTPTQYEGVLREIDAVQARLLAPRTAAPVAPVPGINTPIGYITPVTGVLLAAIWIVFALESIQPGGSTSTSVLVEFGATTSNTLSLGEYWRLLATCFLHIGIIHIVSNSIGLIWLGTVAERLYGPLRYLGIYLAAGIGGSIVAVLTASPGDVSAGASGAIMGLLGALLVGSWRNRAVIGAAAGRQLFSGMITLLVLNLVIGFSSANISNAAHIGGAVTGGALALLIPYRSPRYPRTYSTIANVISIMLIVVAVLVAVTYVGAHEPPYIYTG